MSQLEIKINNIPIVVELATDSSSRSLGLMNRYAMPENNGMLFAFPNSQQRSFWMKNTHIPLSIAYISESGQIVDIKNMTPHDERGVPSSLPATYALEMNQGWFDRNQVRCGDTVAGITGIQCESLLRNYVREKLLTESTILTEAARSPQDLPDGIFVQIKPDDWGVRIAYANKLNNVLSTEASITGVVMVETILEDDTDLGPCGGAWMIGSAEATPGWGPMLYDVAMEYATMNGGGLVADRGSVSTAARKVWDYYMNNRGDVTGIQLDDLKNTLTPEEEDNCSQIVATAASAPAFGSEKSVKTDWVKSPLSKRWTKPPTTIGALRAASKLIWQEAGDLPPLVDIDDDVVMLESFIRRIIRENLPPWMIDSIKRREEKEERRREQGRRLPLHRSPLPPPELDKINGPEDDENTIDYTVKQELRLYIKELISEKRFKQMSKPKFTDLKQVLSNSSFLDADPEADLDGEDWSSESAKVLRDTLNDYFDDKFEAGEITALVKVDMMETDPSKGKDAVLKGATYFFDGLHNIEILLANIADGSTFRDINSAHQKIYEVVMHELLHMQQFMKFSRGNPTIEKWDEFKGSYEKAGGSAGMGADYFFFDDPNGPSELETFSFQMANELVDSMGKEDAIRVLQQQNPDHEIIRDNSASFRDIERKADMARPEFREMLKRAKQYAKRLS